MSTVLARRMAVKVLTGLTAVSLVLMVLLQLQASTPAALASSAPPSGAGTSTTPAAASPEVTTAPLASSGEPGVAPAHSSPGVRWTPSDVCGAVAAGFARCDAILLTARGPSAATSAGAGATRPARGPCIFRFLCQTTTTTTRPTSTTSTSTSTTTVAPTTTTVAPTTTTTVAPTTTTTVAPTTTTAAPTTTTTVAPTTTTTAATTTTTTVAPTTTTTATTTTTTVAPTTTTTATTTTTTLAPTTTTTAATTTTTTLAPTTTTVPGPQCAYQIPSSPPSGYGPCDLQGAYDLITAEASLSGNPTVAIVDAYNDPKAAADLATYRSEFGLPACTVASGCFRQLNETGGTTLPSNNASWSQEISLDLDTVSAVCPNCHIALVEGNSAGFSDLAKAENTAASLNPIAISNSYGGSEFSGETSYDTDYHHAGIAITVSAGDDDYGVEYPAASPYVTAVGGTSLTKTAGSGRGWTETVWGPTENGQTEGTGSGCSTQEAQPSWQQALDLSGCSRRIVTDVSADANPYTGVAVYDSYSYEGSSGWLVFGGTSVASPIIASVYALSGNVNGIGASLAYANPADLYDVTSGTNSSTGCSPAYLCTAEVGYDGPTGVGTPNGTGAF